MHTGKPSKTNTNSVQTCVMRSTKYQAKKNSHTTDTLNFNFDSCLSFSLPHLFALGLRFIRCKACNKFESTLYAKAGCAETILLDLYISLSTNDKKNAWTLNDESWQREKSKKKEDSERRKNAHEQWNQNSQLVSVVSRDTYPKTHRHTMHVNEISLFSITLS